MPVIYKREGDDPNTSWNELLRQINELVADCPGITPLDEVGPNHIWRKSDIQSAQDKLIELCNQNTFDPIPDLWKKATVESLIAAIQSGACCCEETDIDLTGAPLDNAGIFFHIESGQSTLLIDWAPLIIKDEVDGWGFVGEQYTNWEFYLYTSRTGPIPPIASGNIVNGFIDIGEGTPDGDQDPAWGFPYSVELQSVVSGVQTYQISGADERTMLFTIEDGENLSIPYEGFANNSWVSSPYAIITASDLTEHTRVCFLRLKCQP